MSEDMDKILEYDDLRREITDPEPLAAIIDVLTQFDREAIAAKTKAQGAGFGVLELWSRIKKRGPHAVTKFIDALEKCEYKELAQKIRRKLRDPDMCTADVDETERPIAREVHKSNKQETSQETSSISTAIEEQSHILHSNYTSGNAECESDNASGHLPVDTRNKTLNGPETLLENIPLKLKSKIVSSLDIDSFMGNNWRGIAGEAELTVEDEQKLKLSSSPMGELFTWMVQKRYRLSHLIEMLEKQGRIDIIKTIQDYGFAEKSESQQDINLQETRLSSPNQPSNNVTKKPSDEKQPDQNQSHKLSQEAREGNDEEEALTSAPLDDIPEDDVLLKENIEGKAIFIGVEAYQHMKSLSKLNKEVNHLASDIEYHGWKVVKTSGKDCSSEKMKKSVSGYLGDIKQNDVCLVYLAGHTVQINGQNYLLASEANARSTAADVIECSLNMNNLITELTRCQPLMILFFIDGAHTNNSEFSSGVVSEGLATMVPPPNTVISFPCKPCQVRPENETLRFIKELQNLMDRQDMTPSMLFAELKQKIPSTTEFCMSPRSYLPLYIHTVQGNPEGPALCKPLSDTPRLAFIFCNDTDKKEHLKNDAEHLIASLKQLDWTVNEKPRSEYQDIKRTIRDMLINLDRDEFKVVMLYFIGFESQDTNSLIIGGQSVTITWLVHLMTEYVCGPKAVIVDELRSHVPQSLEILTPLPQEVLVSVPKERKMDNNSPTRDSFTLYLAQKLARFPEKSLRGVIKASVSEWEYQQVESSLFYV